MSIYRVEVEFVSSASVLVESESPEEAEEAALELLEPGDADYLDENVYSVKCDKKDLHPETLVWSGGVQGRYNKVVDLDPKP